MYVGVQGTEQEGGKAVRTGGGSGNNSSLLLNSRSTSNPHLPALLLLGMTESESESSNTVSWKWLFPESLIFSFWKVIPKLNLTISCSNFVPPCSESGQKNQLLVQKKILGKSVRKNFFHETQSEFFRETGRPEKTTYFMKTLFLKTHSKS